MASTRIAVLPFAAMGGDWARDFIASGLTSNLTDELSSRGNLHVVARYSDLRLEGDDNDVVRIGRQIGAEFVLKGGVRSLGGDLLIVAQLIDTQAGIVLWKEKFDGRLDELFIIQHKIVAAVAAHTGAGRSTRDTTIVKRKMDPSLWALECRAWQEILSFTPAGLMRGEEYARELLAQAPRLPQAYDALCNAKFHLLVMGFRPPAPDFRREIVHLAEEYLQRKPDDANALRVLAMVLIDCEARPGDALDLLHRAVELDPTNVLIYGQMGDACIMAGRPDKALRLERFAIDLDPMGVGNYFRYAAMAAASFERSDFEGAVRQARQSIELRPDYALSHALAAASLALGGDLSGARNTVIAARKCLPGLSREGARDISLFRKEWRGPFEAGLAAAGL